MASQWRIRHKLMLGLVLVVGTIAVLLGGTWRGLTAYDQVLHAIRRDGDELDAAEKLKKTVADLTRSYGEVRNTREGDDGPAPGLRNDYDPFEQSILNGRIAICRQKLDEYEAKFNANPEQERDPNRFDHLKDLNTKLRQDFLLLEKEALEYARRPQGGANIPDAQVKLASSEPIRKKIADMERNTQDRLNIIYTDLVEKTKLKPYQSALLIIIPASVVGLLSIVGLLRVFRWIFLPIRDLEAGVKRVAGGDFDQPIALNSGDEMEDLAAAFNDMTGRLRELYVDLARQVNERSRQLVRSERLASVGFLAAGVAHEINNPLASIAFCSEALEGRLPDLLALKGPSGVRSEDEEVFKRYLKMIQEEAFRCKKITEKLLEFSRSSERRREPTDLAGLVRSVIDITQHLQSCKGKEIVFDPPSERVGRISVPVNAEEVKSVVLNLVVNALDSMEEGGQLTIHLDVHDGMYEMSFKDTGCGMTQEVLENIFEPFYTRSRTGKGTGLGLTISHRIINQHGGEIEAASDGPSKGSTFIVRLPLTESEPRQEHAALGDRARRAA